MQQAFVIHIHSGHGRSHYDLMLLRGETLATWQLLRSPVALEVGESLAARKLPDHRAAYLTYEGPLSRERGKVKRLDRGSYQLLTEQSERWELVFNGQKITGRYELEYCGPDVNAWIFRRLSED
jgi:hypothetical protein